MLDLFKINTAKWDVEQQYTHIHTYTHVSNHVQAATSRTETNQYFQGTVDSSVTIQDVTCDNNVYVIRESK